MTYLPCSDIDRDLENLVISFLQQENGGLLLKYHMLTVSFFFYFC